MSHNRWHDDSVDIKQLVLLQDLTTVFSNVSDVKFELTYGSFIDLKEKRITGSSLWNSTQPDIQKSGYKTDVYLRSIGTLYYSHLPSFQQFWQDIEGTKLSKFATELFALLEDLRLEEIIKAIRPGTKQDFAIRKTYLQHFFSTQLTTNITRSLALDELYCMIYILLQSNRPEYHFPHANQRQIKALDFIKPLLYQSFDARTTKDIVNITTQIVWKLNDAYQDVSNVYFTFPIFQWKEDFKRHTLFDELTRTDDLANQDTEKFDKDENEYLDETFSTWHRENENADRKQSFLQMDLEVGTKTNLKGGDARETESGDQAFGMAQGTSGKSKREDYSNLETLEKQAIKKASEKNKAPYGEENVNAVKIIKHAIKPTQDDLSQYKAYFTEIEPYKRRLSQTIRKMLEHKKTSSRNKLYYGRLSKNFLPIVLENNPRLFYKKDQESTEFDATFTLMVDCSASMYAKMNETKRGIVLFHELLKDLKIPHSIIGFWENVQAASRENISQPNYFHIIHSFKDSLYEDNGAKIMQLEAEEDNRDGFSIRVVTEKMLEQREKHKFLLVFSDGEPSASHYEQNGIMDTRLAVSEARKNGINVIGMFLADRMIEEHEEETMNVIYGHQSLIINDLEELPERFTAILKKLILHSL